MRYHTLAFWDYDSREGQKTQRGVVGSFEVGEEGENNYKCEEFVDVLDHVR